MKIKLLAAVAAIVLATSSMAQSAFQGFYGEIATGYESNSVSNGNINTTDSTWNASSQNFGGAPIVIGVGYNFSVAPQWLVGLGVDYSILPQTSSSYTVSNSANGSNNAGGALTGATYKTSNRYNITVSPGYVIDKDKLAYLKAGYSSVSLTNNGPTNYVDYGDSGNNGPVSVGSQSKTLSGYIIGLGYKQMITSGLYGYAEGNYMSYGKANFSATASDGTLVTSNPSLNSYQLLVGIGYKF